MQRINMSMRIYKLSRNLYLKNIALIPQLLKYLNRIIFSCDIPYQAEVDYSVILGHNALGTVIHEKAIIGKNTLVMHHVTVGGNMDRKREINGETFTAPVIGENVMIGVGAKILGPITIGDYAQIGSGSVVLHDLPPRAIAVGMPAKVTKILTEAEARETVKKWL